MHYTINIIEQLKPILIGFRKSQKLSQKDMAERLCISYQVLESNPKKVSVGRLFKVLNLLGVKLILSDTPMQHNCQVTTDKSNTQNDAW